MLNSNWYLVCDTIQNKAIDIVQIQETWGSATGLLEQSDEDLEAFNLWSPHKNISFMKVDRAKAVGIDNASIDTIVTLNKPVLVNWLRSMRDPLLAASDAITASDRWNSLDVVNQMYASQYRQALRDLTQQDLFNVVWPDIPPVLDFIRTTSLDGIERPSQDFLDSLSKPFPELTLDQKRNNQWLRIKADRDLRTAAGLNLTVNGVIYWFWTDDSNRAKYSILDSYATRNNLPGTALLDNWKTMSGDFVPFTVDLLHQVLDAGVINEKLIFNTAETHHQAVMASDDPDNYDYSTGYPQTYGEYVKAQSQE